MWHLVTHKEHSNVQRSWRCTHHYPGWSYSEIIPAISPSSAPLPPVAIADVIPVSYSAKSHQTVVTVIRAFHKCKRFQRQGFSLVLVCMTIKLHPTRGQAGKVASLTVQFSCSVHGVSWKSRWLYYSIRACCVTSWIDYKHVWFYL